MERLASVEIVTEFDIVTARQLVRDMAKSIGFDTVDQARITTALSELAKNIYLYAQNGQINIEEIENGHEKGIAITAIDNGPGIYDVKSVLGAENSNSKGLGAGLPGVKRLMDSIDIKTEVGIGTNIRVEKWLR